MKFKIWRLPTVCFLSLLCPVERPLTYCYQTFLIVFMALYVLHINFLLQGIGL